MCSSKHASMSEPDAGAGVGAGVAFLAPLYVRRLPVYSLVNSSTTVAPSSRTISS